MDTIWFSTCLLLVPLLIAPGYGFFLQKTMKASFGFGDRLLDEVSTFAKRDTDMVNETDATIYAHPCDVTQECFSHQDSNRLISQMFGLYFDRFSQELKQSCPLPEVSSCLHHECHSPAMREMAAFMENVIQFACNHSQQFQDSAPCWEHPFRDTMERCTRHPNHRLELVRQCFADSVRTLPGCTPEAQDFFINFSGHVIDEQLAMQSSY